MSKRFQIVSVVQPSMPWNNGFRELVETLQWGLSALGHEVSVNTNRIENDVTNIVLGFQLLVKTSLDQLPSGTIIYNVEQLYGLGHHQIMPCFHAAAKRFQIWEYSERNLPMWTSLGAARPIVHVPIGWAPILARIPRSETMDIDVLFYGFPSSPRMEVFRSICTAGMRSVFACGLYGSNRDDLISRSKLILNLTLHKSRIFEVVRASYLFANAKAVVSEVHPDTFIEPDLRDAAIFVSPNMIVATCKMLLDNDMLRIRLEKRGEEIFRRRDIRQVLHCALEASFASATV